MLEIIEKAMRDQVSELDLSDKEFTELPPEIGKLSNLTSLKAWSTPLRMLPPEIGKLTKLKKLSFWGNQLTSLPFEISKLNQLEWLDVSKNQLTDIPIWIDQLTNLHVLDLANNQFTKIPPEIGGLKNLTILNLEDNKIAALPAELVNLNSLTILSLNRNPLPIPPEILKLDKPAELLNYYFQHQSAQGKKSLNEAKMLVVGEGEVGKTSLVKMLIDGKYDPYEKKTEGINIRKWFIDVDRQKIRLNVWDFGGQEIMHATHQFFLTKRSIYLLVLNARKGEQESRIEYWLKLIQSFGGDSPVIVVTNKVEQHPLDIDRRGLQNKYGTIKAFVDTSCEKAIGVGELKEIIVKEVSKLEHIHDQLLNSWFSIKTRLEEMKQDYISYEEYKYICKVGGIVDEISQVTLIRFLHDLGIVLNFLDDPRFKDTNILNPDWVTNGVYTILNSNELFQDKGVLALEKLNDILDREKYPESKHRFIIEMMEKFELCFGFEGHQKFLIPDLLSKEEPDLNWSYDDSLAFQYHYNFLPNSIISRFIVRMHPYISRDTYWRTGVVLKKGQNKALIKADLEDRKIFIYVAGNEHTRRNFLEIVRADFDRIHQTIPKIEAKEKVPLPGYENIVVDYGHLLDLEAMGEETLIPEGLKQRVSVKKLLDGIETEEDRKDRREDRIKEDKFQQINQSQQKGSATVIVNNPWLSGSFYLTALVILVTTLAIVSNYISWLALPIVLIAGLLATGIIGALQLRNDDRFSEDTFLKLMIESFKRLPLLRGETSSEISVKNSKDITPSS